MLGTNVSVGPPPQDAASILLAGHPFKLPDRLLAWDISDIPKFSLTQAPLFTTQLHINFNLYRPDSCTTLQSCETENKLYRATS